MEHATPDILADRLDLFLDYPPANPVGEPIPRCDGQRLVRSMVALTALSAGQRAQVIRCELAGAPQSFLNDQGIRPGGWLEVVATAGDGFLIKVGQTHVALTRGLAETILVEPEAPASKPSRIILDDTLVVGARPGPSETPEPTANRHMEEATKMQIKEKAATRQIPLRTLRAGQRGVVVHVGSKGPVKRRMMDMGLVPGAEVNVWRCWRIIHEEN